MLHKWLNNRLLNMKLNMKQKGYTIIELLIVMIIIAIVAMIATNTYQRQREVIRYNESVAKVVSMIKTARNYAISSRTVYDPDTFADDPLTPQNESLYVPEEGYGIYIEQKEHPDQSKVVLFANTAVDDVEANQYDDGSDILEEDYILPSDTLLNPILCQKEPTEVELTESPCNAATAQEVVILFRPPMANVYLADNTNPLIASGITELNEFYLKFQRLGAPEDVPGKFIYINKVAGFPELEL